MQYRDLGSTGLEVSVIGFGAWGIGGVSKGPTSYGPTDDRVSLAALKRALDLGVTFYDTADVYGDGHSEELIGGAFRHVRDGVILASKVGISSYNRPQVFSPEHIRKSLEGTLRRLQADYLDLYQLHSPPIRLVQRDRRILDALSALRREGKIRAFGISVRAPEDGIIAINELGFQTVQVNFNMADQRALVGGLFDLAYKKNVGVIVRTPLNFGFLSGRPLNTHFDPRDHRSAWPPEQLRKWAEAALLFSKLNEGKRRTLAQLALQFCLAAEGVSTVIPGMLNPQEVEENVGASRIEPLTGVEISVIRDIYRDSEFFIRSHSQSPRWNDTARVQGTERIPSEE